MAKTIIENMERERDAGNLELGRVGNEKKKSCIDSHEKEFSVEADLEIRNKDASNGISDVKAEELIIENVSDSRFGRIAENL